MIMDYIKRIENKYYFVIPILIQFEIQKFYDFDLKIENNCIKEIEFRTEYVTELIMYENRRKI